MRGAKRIFTYFEELSEMGTRFRLICIRMIKLHKN